jgi:hypothetical protein
LPRRHPQEALLNVASGAQTDTKGAAPSDPAAAVADSAAPQPGHAGPGEAATAAPNAAADGAAQVAAADGGAGADAAASHHRVVRRLDQHEAWTSALAGGGSPPRAPSAGGGTEPGALTSPPKRARVPLFGDGAADRGGGGGAGYELSRLNPASAVRSGGGAAARSPGRPASWRLPPASALLASPKAAAGMEQRRLQVPAAAMEVATGALPGAKALQPQEHKPEQQTPGTPLQAKVADGQQSTSATPTTPSCQAQAGAASPSDYVTPQQRVRMAPPTAPLHRDCLIAAAASAAARMACAAADADGPTTVSSKVPLPAQEAPDAAGASEQQQQLPAAAPGGLAAQPQQRPAAPAAKPAPTAMATSPVPQAPADVAAAAAAGEGPGLTPAPCGACAQGAPASAATPSAAPDATPLAAATARGMDLGGAAPTPAPLAGAACAAGPLATPCGPAGDGGGGGAQQATPATAMASHLSSATPLARAAATPAVALQFTPLATAAAAQASSIKGPPPAAGPTQLLQAQLLAAAGAPKGLAGAGAGQALPSVHAQPGCEPRGSAAARSRLHALLEGL